jgi:ElaB/YqjD/DUF883 family membrane-anchored ribosome-binding protein
MASKQNQESEEWEDALRQLKEDLDERLEVVQRQLSKSAERQKRIVDEQTEGLRERFVRIGSSARDGFGRADDLVREHPVVLVGGALAFGLLLGALLSRSGED